MVTIGRILPAPFTEQVMLAMLQLGVQTRLLTNLVLSGESFGAAALRPLGAGPSCTPRDIRWPGVMRKVLGSRVSRTDWWQFLEQHTAARFAEARDRS